MKNSFLLLLCFISIVSVGQDLHFSQFTNTPLLVNPGLTGMGNGYSRANLNYRSQWTTTDNSFSTAALSVDFPIFSEKMNWKNGYLGTGLTFYNDNAGSGVLNSNEANLALSSVLFVGKRAKISLGIMGGYMQKSINPDVIQWDSQYNGYQYDPSLPSQENFITKSAGDIDFSAGMAYRYSVNQIGLTSNGHGRSLLLELGGAAYHLFEPKFDFQDNSVSQVSRRFVGHARFLKTVQSPFVLGANALFMQQAASQELTVGFEARYILSGNTKYTGFIKDSYVGLQVLYRNQDAVIPVLFFKFNNWKISTSYDYNVSDLNSVTGGVGGFEISIQFNDFEGELFNQGNKHTNYRGSTGNF